MAESEPGSSAPVVHLTGEYYPFVRTGGLAEAVAGLAEFQAGQGIKTTVILPLHRRARETAGPLEVVLEGVYLELGHQSYGVRILELPGTGDGPRVLFVEHHDFFDRPGVYGEGGVDYPDNALRFGLFCKAAVKILPHLLPSGGILHAHDWHTALAPVFLRTAEPGWGAHPEIGTVFSVHNAGYQGHLGYHILDDLGLPPELYDWRWMEWYGKVNILKGGLKFSDIVTTVSPTHAFELRTEAGGFGLHSTFQDLHDRLYGITNGIDQAVWNPETDPELPANFSVDDLSGKAACKEAVQRRFGLEPRPDLPLVVMVARMARQKGFDLVLNSELLPRAEAQFVFHGGGDTEVEAAVRKLAETNPGIAVETPFQEPLEHVLLGGGDIVLMPSQYEPCGLTQLRAQRYGAIPLARRVGGLADTIEDGRTGVLFDGFDSRSFDGALHRILRGFGQPDVWERMVRRAMRCDFSWDRTVEQYSHVYEKALARSAPGA